MKTAAPFIRLAFLALFLVLLRSGFLLVWLILYLLSLLIPLLFGKRLYCVLLCPMNTLMSYILKLKKRMNLKNRPAPEWLAGGKMAWVSLFVTIAVFVISRKALGKDFPMMVVWIIVASVMTLFYHPDVFHDGVCPFGVAQRQFARQSLLDEDARKKALDYQGFTKSVLGGGAENKPV